jgi:polyisoprenoid-binding protein YceI
MTGRNVTVIRSRNHRRVPVAGTYMIDSAHTTVEFIGRHLMITKVRGRFTDVSGQITIAEQPERSHVEADITVASLTTGNADRDAHLRMHAFCASDSPSVSTPCGL